MIIESILRVPDARDATLCVGAIRFLKLVLGQNHRSQRGIHFVCRSQPRQTTSDNQNIRKKMPAALGLDRHKIARRKLGPRLIQDST